MRVDELQLALAGMSPHADVYVHVEVKVEGLSMNVRKPVDAYGVIIGGDDERFTLVARSEK